MEKVRQPCVGCANILCFHCSRYPRGLKDKERTLMFFHNNKWEGFPPPTHNTLMKTFLRKESIVHAHGSSSYIIDFDKMAMINTKTGEQKHLAWRDPEKPKEGFMDEEENPQDDYIQEMEKVDENDRRESCASNQDILEAELFSEGPAEYEIGE